MDRPQHQSHRPPRPGYERSHKTADGGPNSLLKRSSRLESIASLSDLNPGPHDLGPAPAMTTSQRTSKDSSPSSLSTSLPPSPGGFSSWSPTPPSSAALSAMPSPSLPHRALGASLASSPSMNSLAHPVGGGGGAGGPGPGGVHSFTANKPTSVHSSSASSTRTNTGFVVTSRSKHYVPPPDSPGPPFLMAKSPFYRSTPPGSRDNSRNNSRNNSREVSPTRSSGRGSIDREQRSPTSAGGSGGARTSPFPPPHASTSTGFGAAMSLAAVAGVAFAPSLAPMRRGSSPAAFPSSPVLGSSTGAGTGPGPSSALSRGYVSGADGPVAAEPKTTRTLSSSIDSKGRRMVNQYVRLKTIGQGSHGKVWLCAEPSDDVDDDELREEALGGGGGDDVRRRSSTASAVQRQRRGSEDPHAAAGAGPGAGGDGRGSRRRPRTATERWEADIDAGRVRYCAIKSVARDGPGGAKGHRSLRLAAQSKASATSGSRKQSSQGSGGIGADDKVKREVAIMKRLDHPNIVRLKEVIDDVKSRKVFMVLEFMAGGQVEWQDDNKQPTMTVDEARRTFRDVVLGLEYLHYQGIIHRDIKPANLLWTEDHSTVKISDFGVSHVSEALMRCSDDDDRRDHACHGEDDKALRKTAGSPAFFAPELCFPAEATPTPTAHYGSSAALSRMGTRDSVGLNSVRGDAESETYFPRGVDGTRLTPTSSGANFTPPTSPNGLPLSTVVISRPLPPPSPSKPRTRPPVGRGIDVWALGVTLYCLLFGDTPFTARTEYELYNVIVREGIRVPEKMGREGAWTGVGQGWPGCGTGEEGREVVDLLGRLLEKDPTKRITLEEVKKHPWVLRNLSNPDSWLRATDLAQTTHVTVTEDDVEHATQQRSAGTDALLPPIRNRPGIKRALNAALARFPAFARIKSTRTTASTNSEETAGVATAHERDREREQRSRSKSNSSTGHSVGGGEGHGGPGTGSSTLVSDSPASGSVSRQPSDGGANFERRGKSREGGGGFGMDLRRIISGGRDGTGQSSGTASPAMGSGHRGGWGNRSFRKTPSMEPHPPPGLPELSRSISSSSVLGTSPNSGNASRSHFSHHFFGRKVSDTEPAAARSSASSSAMPSPSVTAGGRSSGFSSSPWAGSDTESAAQAAKGGRSLSRMLSRLHSHGGAGTPGSSSATSANASVRSGHSGARQFSGSTDGGGSDDHHGSQLHSRVVSAQSLSPGVSPHVIEQYEAAGATRDQYDALGRLVVQRGSKDRSASGASSGDRLSFKAGLDAAKAELDATEDDDGQIDLTEFEYSDSDDDLDDDDDDDDDDDLDDFMQPPLAQGNHLSGWNYPGFADFQMGPRTPLATTGADAGTAATSAAYLSPTHTPPTDDVEQGDDVEDGKVGPRSTPDAAAASSPPPAPAQPPSPPYVPYADSVSFQLCPLDLDFESLGFYGSSSARRSEASDDQTPIAAVPAHSVNSPSAAALSAGLQIPIPPPPTLAEAYASSTRSRSPRDGSIRGVSLDPPSPRKASAALDAWGDEDEDGDEEEILVVPRRRRAATLQGLGGVPTSPR
ncbi:hypothetical protein JCM3775_001458 [Rhodotorula graminis]